MDGFQAFSGENDSMYSVAFKTYEFGTSDPIDDEKGQDKSKERNREHAKRTRLRKKALLEGMKGRLLDLQKEAAQLQQSFDQNNTANILLCLSTKSDPSNLGSDSCKDDPCLDFDSSTMKGNILDHLRSKVRLEAIQNGRSRTANVSSMEDASPIASGSTNSTTVMTSFNTPGHDSDEEAESNDDDTESNVSHNTSKGSVNWKLGTLVSEEGEERKLSVDEMETLRKERNRMHAKLTRDRKKLFTSRLQQMINSLERQNSIMRNRLKTLTVGKIGSND